MKIKQKEDPSRGTKTGISRNKFQPIASSQGQSTYHRLQRIIYYATSRSSAGTGTQRKGYRSRRNRQIQKIPEKRQIESGNFIIC